MRILLTGKNGQVGWELNHALAPLGEVIALDRSGLDLTVPEMIVSRVREVKPDIIVNAAAYTAVDRAESEPELAMALNAEAPRALARAAQQVGALLVHYSTDYVFDGSKQGPYTETDTPAPLNVYGRSKLGGDLAVMDECRFHLILRTSWVFGSRGSNFLLTILRKAKVQPELRVVRDQLGTPTWCRMIAETTAQILAQEVTQQRLPISWNETMSGIYNLVPTGATSWYEFAQEIVAQAGLATRIVPISSVEYPLAAIRPANSRLDITKIRSTFHLHIPSWKECLSLCMRDIPLGLDLYKV